MLDGVPPDTRVLIANVDWEFYDAFSRTLRDVKNSRVAYDGNDIEMLTAGPLHERYKSRSDLLIGIIALELGVIRQAVGSTTWKRKKVKRGVEPDSSYYFDPEKMRKCIAAEAKGSNNVNDYPDPDLVVEIDISPSRIDRAGIYAALEVQELWRIRNKTVFIDQLAAPGNYAAAHRSQFLRIRPEDVTRWLFAEYESDPTTWEQRLREWVRAELV